MKGHFILILMKLSLFILIKIWLAQKLAKLANNTL